MKQLAVLSLFGILIGCTSSTESAERNKLTTHVGVYDPPPSGLKRVRVGVPPFKVEKTSLPRKDELARDAADQLTTLGDKTDRFAMIERAQLDQLLKEQGLEGVVDPEELAKPGRVKGVDFLFIGKVTNMRVKSESSGTDWNVIIVGGSSSNAKVKVECGVDIRLVDPTSGEVLCSEFGEYTRTDSVSAQGLRIIGLGGGSSADLHIDEDSRGLILRLALDDAVRKMLQRCDRRLMERQK